MLSNHQVIVRSELPKQLLPRYDRVLERLTAIEDCRTHKLNPDSQPSSALLWQPRTPESEDADDNSDNYFSVQIDKCSTNVAVCAFDLRTRSSAHMHIHLRAHCSYKNSEACPRMLQYSKCSKWTLTDSEPHGKSRTKLRMRLVRSLLVRIQPSRIRTYFTFLRITQDWSHWMTHFSLELLKQSPSVSLRVTQFFARVYEPIRNKLFNAAFYSCWVLATQRFGCAGVSAVLPTLLGHRCKHIFFARTQTQFRHHPSLEQENSSLSLPT